MASKTDREHVAIASADPTADRAAQLRALFPDVFADGKLDVASLRSALGDAVAGEGEGYKFSWEGSSGLEIYAAGQTLFQRRISL